jgi:hypothetical protein
MALESPVGREAPEATVKTKVELVRQACSEPREHEEGEAGLLKR